MGDYVVDNLCYSMGVVADCESTNIDDCSVLNIFFS